MKAFFPRPLVPPGLLLLAVLACGHAAASGDAAAGARKAVFCAYCHGTDGNPSDAKVPRLAGQNARTLVAKMKREKPYDNAQHPMLQAFITGGCLNDQDIGNLAAFYASQPVRRVTPPATGK